MAFPLGNLAALRTFRVLRALKTVAVVPGKDSRDLPLVRVCMRVLKYACVVVYRLLYSAFVEPLRSPRNITVQGTLRGWS